MTVELRWVAHVGLVGALTAGAAGCTATPPPSWVEGGAPLAFGHAVWTQVDGSQLSLDELGQVLVNGEFLVALDRVGRVVDASNDPVALLDAEGQLFGTDKAYLGRIGLHNASPPWSPEAWVRVSNKGSVVLFDADGESSSAGRWVGCDGPVLRACTLLTHLVLLESVQRPPRRGPYYGPSPSWYGPSPSWGMGFGFYY
jgi:hypothetical protein